MSVRFPDGWRIDDIDKHHRRDEFDCGLHEVNNWLRRSARQAHDKRLSSTRVLLDETGRIAGYYTVAAGQVLVDELPHEIARRLPRPMVPVAILGWLGVDQRYRGQGLGERLLAHALWRCRDAGKTMPFVAVVLDCLNEDAKRFFQRFQFMEFPMHPMRLLLPVGQLEAMWLDLKED